MQTHHKPAMMGELTNSPIQAPMNGMIPAATKHAIATTDAPRMSPKFSLNTLQPSERLKYADTRTPSAAWYLTHHGWLACGSSTCT